MTARKQPGRSLIENLAASKYGRLQRLGLIVTNTFRKIPGGGCCGQYGEPGC